MAGRAVNGGVFKEGRAGIGILILLIGSMMTPSVPVAASASSLKLIDSRLLIDPWSTLKACWGMPRRFTGPQ